MRKLIQGLHQFQSHYYPSHQHLFEQLAHGQQPRVLFITCSDSRIDPNLITQADVGELFVIRNAGNIIPPFDATNGGEGATLEYAIHALGIEQIIICGHSNCGAMKGLFKLDFLKAEMPLVYDWLKYAEPTRRLLKESYQHCAKESLLDIAIAENVLNQMENLHTYPVIRSRLYQGRLKIHGWIYDIESGQVLTYDASHHEFVPLDNPPLPSPEPPYSLRYNCPLPQAEPASRAPQSHNHDLPGLTHLPREQAERIYYGSQSH